ncbi:MAG: LLM class flavin-dependent oxidoreductase [Beutenbergiaceae bacterium]
MTIATGRVGVMLPRDLPADQFVPYARRADEAGFDELWVVEDLGFRGGIAQAAAALAVTHRIAVGIGILPAGARNAAFAAMELASLEQLFPGRVIGGIGHGMPGWMRSVGAWPSSPLTLLREHTSAVRQLLRGRPGPAAGRYVDVAGVRLEQVPSAPPPVLLGVRGRKSLLLAGDVSDGILLAEPGNPAYIRAARQAAGMSTDDPRAVVAYDVAHVADDSATALATVRPALAAIGEPDWAPHIAPLPFADEFAALRARCADGAEFAAVMPDEWIGELSLAGTPSEVAGQIAARHEAGATSVVFIPAASDPLVALDQLAPVLPGDAMVGER